MSSSSKMDCCVGLRHPRLTTWEENSPDSLLDLAARFVVRHPETYFVEVDVAAERRRRKREEEERREREQGGGATAVVSKAESRLGAAATETLEEGLFKVMAF